jgi:tRNA(Ile)-lysidine synthase
LGLAVSGGADSLALLLLATATLPGRVEVATVNHGLRSESADEAAMVARVCAELAVPHEVLPVTLAPGNLQHRARVARYAALGEWCERRGLVALATAHQLDDQAETLAMRLNRGSGLAGLAGVRARSTVSGDGLPLLRPLLDWRRAELANIVAEAGLEPAQDPSNEDERFDRVQVRRALAEADWLDPKGLAGSAAHLAEAERFVGEQIAAMAGTRLRAIDGGYALDPPPSDFAAAELCALIIAKLDAAPRRGEVAALVARLRRGENASLGGVLARVAGAEWVFAPEPPRSR